MPDVNETIGQRVRRLREKAELSQEDLGDSTSLGFRIIARVEAGTPVGEDFLSQIADALKVTLEHLKTGHDNSQHDSRRIVERELRARFGSPVLVQECLEEFLQTVRFRNENLSDADGEVLKEKLDEYLSIRAVEDEMRAFGSGG